MKKASSAILVVLAVILLTTAQSFAGAPLTLLRGDYYVAGSRSCVYATGYNQDFGPNYSLPFTGGTMRTGHYDGKLRLNGDGTGDFTFNFIQYYFQNTNGGQIPIGVFPGSCLVLYETLQDGMVDLTLTQCTSTGTAGVGMGTTWLNDDETLKMAATRDGEVLVLSNTEPEVETTSLNGDPAFPIRRICSRTFTGVRQSIR